MTGRTEITEKYLQGPSIYKLNSTFPNNPKVKEKSHR